MKNSSYVTPNRKLVIDLGRIGFLKVKSFKYLGVYISARRKIVDHRKQIRVQFPFSVTD